MTSPVLVRNSRTDREGRGAQVYLAPDSVVLVHEWLDQAGINESNVF